MINNAQNKKMNPAVHDTPHAVPSKRLNLNNDEYAAENNMINCLTTHMTFFCSLLIISFMTSISCCNMKQNWNLIDIDISSNNHHTDELGNLSSPQMQISTLKDSDIIDYFNTIGHKFDNICHYILTHNLCNHQAENKILCHRCSTSSPKTFATTSGHVNPNNLNNPNKHTIEKMATSISISIKSISTILVVSFTAFAIVYGIWTAIFCFGMIFVTYIHCTAWISCIQQTKIMVILIPQTATLINSSSIIIICTNIFVFCIILSITIPTCLTFVTTTNNMYNQLPKRINLNHDGTVKKNIKDTLLITNVFKLANIEYITAGWVTISCGLVILSITTKNVIIQFFCIVTMITSGISILHVIILVPGLIINLFKFGVIETHYQSSFGYCLIKYGCQIPFFFFYHTIEISGKSKFPMKGPVIVAPAPHLSWFLDGGLTIMSMPRCCKLLVKHDLFDRWFFKWFVKAIDAIPIKRKMDFSGGKDLGNSENKCNSKNNNNNNNNSNAFDNVFKAFDNNECVCIFPEGTCSYRPCIDKLKTGCCRLALDYVLNRSKTFDYVTIVPVGITHLHRRLFRSSICIQIGDPIRIDHEFYDKEKQKEKEKEETENLINLANVDRDKDETKSVTTNNSNTNNNNKTKDSISRKIARRVTKQMTHSLLSLTISSPDWHIIVLGHLARQIMFPKSSNPKYTNLSTYVNLTQQFINVLTLIIKPHVYAINHTKEEENNPQKIAEKAKAMYHTDDDVDMTHMIIRNNKAAMHDTINRNFNVTQQDIKQIEQCVNILEEYFQMLYKFKIEDKQVLELSKNLKPKPKPHSKSEANPNSASSTMTKYKELMWYFTCGLIFAVCSTPGFLFYAPLLYQFNVTIPRSCEGKRMICMLDEVGQKKILLMFFGGFGLAIVYSIAIVFITVEKIYATWYCLAFLLIGYPLICTFIFIRGLEELFACMRAIFVILRHWKLESSLNSKMDEKEMTSTSVWKLIQARKQAWEVLNKNILVKYNIVYDKKQMKNSLEQKNWRLINVWKRNNQDWNETLSLTSKIYDEYHMDPRFHKFMIYNSYTP